MEIKNYIHTYEQVMKEQAVDVLIKVCDDFEYQEAGVVSAGKTITNKEVRNVFTKELVRFSKSMTEVHWSNWLTKVFRELMLDWMKRNDIPTGSIMNIENIQLLKYEVGGHYKWHFDQCSTLNRQLSGIFFLNDDYEGGNIEFAFPKSNDSMSIKPKKNSCLIWPSGFLFPHRVTPVTKGTRYSVVCWAH